MTSSTGTTATSAVRSEAAKNRSFVASMQSAASYGSATAVGTFTVDSTGRVTSASNTTIAIAQSAVTNLVTDLAAKAPLDSPALTGTPTVPTRSSSVSNTTAASTDFVNSLIGSGQWQLVPHYTASTNWALTSNGTGTSGYARQGAGCSVTSGGAGNATAYWTFANLIANPGLNREAVNLAKPMRYCFTFFLSGTSANVTARITFGKKTGSSGNVDAGEVGAMNTTGWGLEVNNATIGSFHYNSGLTTGASTLALSTNTGYAVEMITSGAGALVVIVNGTVLETYASGVFASTLTSQPTIQLEITNNGQSEAGALVVQNIRLFFGR